MQLLLSCAKTMATDSAVRTPRTATPRFAAQADLLAARLAALSVGELARELKVGERIATENRRRYFRFHDTPARAALEAYAGIVFRRIAPETFSADDFEYAQRHLNITSFLYGLLRPLDAIRPYRLEGAARIPGLDGRSLFEFWQPQLTDLLIDRVRADDGVLVNLASGEMKRLFDWKRVCREVRVVTPDFRIGDGERLRTVVVYAKMCRGAMTRYLLHRRIDTPEALHDFVWEGFRFDPERSRPDAPLFTLRTP
ncbi:MAG: YaaA family protein [Alistipes sp.]|nr:YaaA family protein [Alistipes sp.]